jgi:hypothetical protein
MPFSVIAAGGWLVPLDGVEVAIGESVSVEVAATGVGITVGVTAGVPVSDELVTEKAPVVAAELAAGRADGTTVPVWLEVQPRPWHTFELGVETPVAAGTPFTLVVVVLVWAVLVVPDSLVDVPVVEVVSAVVVV